MKTTSYNPSKLEMEFSNTVYELRDKIQIALSSYKILNVKNKINEDNPMLVFKIEDKDGDKHELVVKFIQRAEE